MQQQIRFCKTTDGVRLAYAIAGTGPPLVKVANWLSHIEYDWRAPIWQPTFTRLAGARRLVRYDERGCGLSDWEVEDFSLDAWVCDLEAVVDAAGLDRFPLYGISQGGPIAIAYAVRHPERVTRLVLQGSYARGYALRDPTPTQREEHRLLIELMRLGWGRESDAFRQVFTSQFYPDGSARDLRWFNELQRLSSSSENAARMLLAFGTLDVQALAPLVTVPALVLHSRLDEVVPYAEGRLLATLLPQADFVTLESRHHLLDAGEPAFEPFMRAIEDFLAAGDDATSVPVPFPALTAREADVLEHVAQGLDNGAIARALGIRDKTVRNHVTHVFAKLGVSTRAEAIVKAREAGLGRGATAAGATGLPSTRRA
jgi:pimeloyl-ACP methyl ester carboxylesterase/DNA-binding CsgD family transcriptional regulator